MTIAVEALSQRIDRMASLLDEIETSAESPSRALVRLVHALGEARVLEAAVSADAASFRSVAACAARERLGRISPLADLAFAMQGLGTFALALAGSEEQKSDWLRPAARGEKVAAFAITEPEAGSDLERIATTARREGDEWVLDGEKTFISNAGVADHYVLFARTGTGADVPFKRALTAFVLPADAENLDVEPLAAMGGHPLGTLRLSEVRLSDALRIGEEGEGLRLALATLERFRPTVGAAAVGFALRALEESIAHAKHRVQFGQPLAEQPGIRMALAEMWADLAASRELVRVAAETADDPGATREQRARSGSTAKLFATEAAQRVIDRAVQIHGGRGVLETSVVCRLYQDVRSLRIYEGTTEIQKLLVGRDLVLRGP
ncbi:MAG: acyl-CoA dehydrogenase [Deltaproteobacteria bacterium]|nr:acyl-CoA dehydrogenase [Deltaproteobacteria bacterium]